MKLSLAFALAFLVAVCSSQDPVEGSNDGASSGNFNLAKILQRVQELFAFRKLVMDQVNDGKLTIDELREPISNALKKGVDCFKDKLINFKDSISGLLEEFQTIISNINTGPEPTEGAIKNPLEGIKIFAGLISKFTEIWNSPEAKNMLKEFVEDLKASGKAAEECFKTSLQTDIPEKYDLLKDLWNQSRQHS